MGGHFLFRDATDGGVFRQHADVLDIIQFAKDTELRKFGNTGEEDETQVRVAGFERTIEVTHDVAENREVLFFMYHVEQWRIVFVDEHHRLAARLLVNVTDKFCQPYIGIGRVRMYAVIFFYLFQLGQQVTFQLFLFHVLAQAHVEMQHRIFRPFRFQTFHGQTFEQVPPSFEIGFQSACQQRLAETSGTAQEHVFRRGVCHVVHMLCFVDIQIILVYYFRECLYPDGIKFGGLCHTPFLHVMMCNSKDTKMKCGVKILLRIFSLIGIV